MEVSVKEFKQSLLDYVQQCKNELVAKDIISANLKDQVQKLEESLRKVTIENEQAIGSLREGT